MKQLIKFGLILASICLMATLVLSVTYVITKPKIDQQLKREEETVLLKEIMPDADSFSHKKIYGIEYFEARRKDNLIGYCVRVVGSGYNGFIRLIAGIDPNGIIKGVKVLEHYETPGLGAKITEVKRNEAEPWFLKQFANKSIDGIVVKKDIDAITGATISSRAVSEAINKTVNEFLAGIKG